MHHVWGYRGSPNLNDAHAARGLSCLMHVTGQTRAESGAVVIDAVLGTVIGASPALRFAEHWTKEQFSEWCTAHRCHVRQELLSR